MYKKIYTAGLATYAVMFVFSLLFYKERIILIDNAFYLFDIIQNNNFTIQHSRFIAVLVEVVPVLAVKLSLSLDHIIMLYSCSYILYHFTCYSICGLVLKDYKISIVILLCNILFSAHTFYWTASELPLGMSLMCVLTAWISNEQRRQKVVATILVFLLLASTLAFAHTLLIFPFFFTLVFFYLHKEVPLKYLGRLAALFMITLLIKNVFFRQPYETGSMGNLRNLVKLFPNYFDIYSNRVFARNCLVLYQWIPICCIAILSVYLSSKQWRKLALFCIGFAGYLMLTNISYPDHRTPSLYIENLYFPLALFLALPLVYDVFPVLAQRKASYAITFAILIFATGIARFYIVGKPYRERLAWLQNYYKGHTGEKLMIDARHAPVDTLFMYWATSYEFALLSTAEQDKTASIIFTNQIKEIEWSAAYNNRLVTKWKAFEYKTLDPRYFKITDSVSPYTVIK